MRKFLTLLLMLPFILSSCNSDEPFTADGKQGKLTIKTTVKDATLKSRAIDMSEFYIILEGPTPMVIEYPEEGVIEGLDPGEYTLTLTNYSDFFLPWYEDPRYSGTLNVTVAAGRNNTVEITLTQANTGIFFVYDASLEAAGFGDIVPYVHDGFYPALGFEGENRDLRGYFNPGEVEVYFKLYGEQVAIGDVYSRNLTFEPAQLWRIILKANADGKGGVELDITIDVIDTATDEDTWELTPPDSVVPFISGELVYMGQIDGNPHAGVIVKLNNENESIEVGVKAHLHPEPDNFSLVSGRYELTNDFVASNLYKKSSLTRSEDKIYTIQTAYFDVTANNGTHTVVVTLQGAAEDGAVVNLSGTFEGSFTVTNQAEPLTPASYGQMNWFYNYYSGNRDGTATVTSSEQFLITGSGDQRYVRFAWLVPSVNNVAELDLEGIYPLLTGTEVNSLIPGFDDNGTPAGTFMAQKTNMPPPNPPVYSNIIYIDGGSLMFVRSENAMGDLPYEVKAIFTGIDQNTGERITETLSWEWVTEVYDYTPLPDISLDLEFTEITYFDYRGDFFSSGLSDYMEFNMTAIEDDGTSHSASVIFFQPPGSGMELVEGTYTAARTILPNTFYYGRYVEDEGLVSMSSFTTFKDGLVTTSANMGEGTIRIVKGEGDNYRIEFDVRGKDYLNYVQQGYTREFEMKGFYEGPVELTDRSR